MERSTLDGPRIVVIGPTAAGKTSLAKALSQRFKIPHIELDTLQLDAHWVSAPPAVFQERTLQAMEGHSSWVV
ncbi:MAG TPA: AAA family ATPase, partial [Candidatus Bipolaricaulota bacterium]